MADFHQEIDGLLVRARKAAVEFSSYTQKQVDTIFTCTSLAILGDKINLAEMAVDEGRMGKFEDKMLKNAIVTEYIHNHYRNTKTCGIIDENDVTGLIKLAEPLGVLAGLVPCTSPSGVLIFYVLMCLKTRNSIVLCAHPRTRKTSNRTAELLHKYAVEAGAPKDCIVWIDETTVPKSQYLMKHRDIDVVLATGGAAMVHSAYQCGNPVVGVGAGNCPVAIHRTADVQRAMSDIFISKCFDNGTPCTAESGLIVPQDSYDTVLEAFEKRGGHILKGDNIQKMTNYIFQDGHLNKDIVGVSAFDIATSAGVQVPPDTLVIGCEVKADDQSNVWLQEKLSPLMALVKAQNDDHAVDVAAYMVEHGGLGHSACVHVNEYTDEGREFLDKFSQRMKAAMLSVNCPNTSVAIGNQYNFDYPPSMMRACGSWGKNSVAGPVEIDKMLNIKTVVRRRDDMQWFRVPPKIFFRMGCLNQAIQEMRGIKKAFIVTDKPLVELGYVKRLTQALDSIDVHYHVYADVEPDPSMETIERGVKVINNYQPDAVIGFGGGSPMDAAKIIRLLYEEPTVDLHATTVRFCHIRRRVFQFPSLKNAKSIMVCIPTTSGTGSEVTPFAVVTNPKDQRKYPIGDYELTPHMAIVDPQFVLSMPEKVAAYTGMDALTHGIESLVSAGSNEFNRGMALEAIRLLMKHLPTSSKGGNSAAVQKARTKMHYAATMASISVAQVLVGVVHSMAHALGMRMRAAFHVPHGLACGVFLSFSVMYNSDPKATRQAGTAFLPHSAKARKRYVRLAKYLELTGKTDDDYLRALVERLESVKAACFIPSSVAALGISREAYMEKMDTMVTAAFDDQCSLSNPRVPQMAELRSMMIQAYDMPHQGTLVPAPAEAASPASPVCSTGSDPSENVPPMAEKAELARVADATTDADLKA